MLQPHARSPVVVALAVAAPLAAGCPSSSDAADGADAAGEVDASGCGPTGVCACTRTLDCRDADRCNGYEECVDGRCVAGTPVVCGPAPGPCLASVCDPPSGVCLVVAADPGGPCDDGSACTQRDTCGIGVTAGTCVGGDPVVCAARDACHLAGVCHPATGACSEPPAPDETPCTTARGADGVADERGMCAAGACTRARQPAGREQACTVLPDGRLLCWGDAGAGAARCRWVEAPPGHWARACGPGATRLRDVMPPR